MSNNSSSSEGSRQCTAKSKRSGNRCLRLATGGRFGKVCSMHGGKAPQTLAAAKRREVTANATAEVARLGWEPVENAPELLMSLAGETNMLKSVLSAKVAELNSANLTHVD